MARGKGNHLEKAEIDELIDEFYSSAACAAGADDPELALAGAALFAEACLGLRLGDGDMVPENLGSPEALRAFLASKAGS